MSEGNSILPTLTLLYHKTNSMPQMHNRLMPNGRIYIYWACVSMVTMQPHQICVDIRMSPTGPFLVPWHRDASPTERLPTNGVRILQTDLEGK